MTAADWSFACPDWQERLRDGRSLVPDLPIDDIEGERAVNVFNRLRLPDVPGQPPMSEAAGDWFRDIVRVAFGSLDTATLERRVPELFLMVPKKNNKTTGGAAVALTALLLNRRPNAELQFIGPTQHIAGVAFEQTAGMIEADPERFLQKRFLVREHLKSIVDRKNGSELKIKTFDMKVATGSKPIFVLLDELHLMSAFSYASRLIGQIRGNMAANPESLLIFTTTQSDQAPAGVFKTELQYARSIRDGRIKGGARMLPLLYEFPESVQTDPKKPWLDPAAWPQVMPNLGRSITLDRMIALFKEANEKGEGELRRWASQHLNVEIGLALHADRWRGADYWEQAEDVELTSLEALLERAEVATIGIDGGGLDDLLALAVIGRERGTGRWLIWVRAWARPDVLERRKDIAERLQDFVTDGDLVICERPTQDYEEVSAICAQVMHAGLLPESHGIGLDPVGVAAIIDAIAAEGVPVEQMTAIAQGYRLSGAVWGLERKLADGTAVHAPQAIGAWCVSNAKVEQVGNAVLITKQAAGKAKIDPLIAALNAVHLMARNPQAKSTRSYTESHDVLML